MSRNRKPDTNESQLWTQTISALRTLPLTQDLTLPQRFQQNMMDGAKEEGVSKQAREDAYQRLAKDEAQTIKEIEALEKSYETLSVLIALKSSSPPASTSTPTSSHPTPSSSLPHPSNPIHLPSTPSTSSTPSHQPPPPPPPTAPPAPLLPAPNTIPARLKVNLAANSVPPSPSTPNSALASGPIGTTSRSGSLPRSSPAPVSTPGGTKVEKERKAKPLTAKEQKWAAQLPLQVGRRVAFYSETEKEWLCYRIVKVTLPDGKKERDTTYFIRDIDLDGQPDDPSSFIPTTLRHLLPLPDPLSTPSHPSHPSHYPDYSSGSTVLGLFPDTTSFYKAFVEGREKVKGGRGARGGGDVGGGGMSTASYRLKFDDDEGQIRVVEVGDVVEMPGGKI